MRHRSNPPGLVPGLRPGVASCCLHVADRGRVSLSGVVSGAYEYCVRTASALTLLVTRVLADHHDATVPANHLALVAHLLNARLDLHGSLL